MNTRSFAKLIAWSTLALAPLAGFADTNYNNFAFVEDWSPTGPYEWQGSANGVGVTLSLDGSYMGALTEGNLSGLDYAAKPGSATQQAIQIAANQTWTLSFDQSANVLLYAFYWRGYHTDGPGSPGAYEFNSGMTPISGLEDAQFVPDMGKFWMLLPQEESWGNGILEFVNPVSSIQCTPGTYTTNLWAGSAQVLTVAVASAVPEPSTWAMIGAGVLATLAWRPGSRRPRISA